MTCIAQYFGREKENVKPGRVYRVGVNRTPMSTMIHCHGREFVYSNTDSMLNDWLFYKETDEPTECNRRPIQ